MSKTRIAVLVSGGGTNLQALLNAQDRGEIHSGEIILVVSNQADAYALERAKLHHVETALCARAKGEPRPAWEARLMVILRAHDVDMLVLAGFMAILSADFIAAYRDRIINVHPSLIPSFCGKGFYGLHVHEAALAYGVKVTGATVHYVNEIPDGGRIIAQQAVSVQAGDTPELLQQRVMREAEWILLPRATELVSQQLAKEKAMQTITAAQAAGATRYPGRGIMVGRSADGKKALLCYFIMGRSENSRNRVFVEDGAGLRTQAFDPSKVKDPSLIIYAPVRVLGDRTIVTNGDQTDTIYEHLAQGGSFASALRTRSFEPDAPNFTPRVSAVTRVAKDAFTLEMSILKAADPQGAHANRYFYEYETPASGVGYFLHTYRADGNPIPSFEGEPEVIHLPDDAQSLADAVWNALDADNRVSLWAREIDLTTFEVKSVVVNRNV